MIATILFQGQSLVEMRSNMYILSPRCRLPLLSITIRGTENIFHHNPRKTSAALHQKTAKYTCRPHTDLWNVKKSKSLGYRNLEISFVLFLATFNTLKCQQFKTISLFISIFPTNLIYISSCSTLPCKSATLGESRRELVYRPLSSIGLQWWQTGRGDSPREPEKRLK